MPLASLRPREDGTDVSPDTTWTPTPGGVPHSQIMSDDKDATRISTLGGPVVEDNYKIERPIADLGLNVGTITRARLIIRHSQILVWLADPNVEYLLYENTTALFNEGGIYGSAPMPWTETFPWHNVNLTAAEGEALNFRTREQSLSPFGTFFFSDAEAWVEIDYEEPPIVTIDLEGRVDSGETRGLASDGETEGDASSGETRGLASDGHTEGYVDPGEGRA